MKNQWTTLKSIIARSELRQHSFLSLIDEKGNIVCANASMVRSLDLKNPRLYPTNFFTLLHPLHVPALKTALLDSQITSQSCSAEFSLRNGRYHPMKWQISCVEKNENKGEIYLCVGSKLPDDTGSIGPGSTRKEIEPDKMKMEALPDSASLARGLLDNTPVLSWVLDENATLLFASHSFCRTFQLDEKKSLNQNIFTLLPPTVAGSLHSHHLQVFETGVSLETVEKMMLADGTNLVFQVNIFPIESATGRKIVGGNAVNLADKYAVEEQLRETNDRLLLLTRATSDAIWEWDMQTGYIFRNDTLMNMIGYQAENTKGLSWWLRRIHPDDRNKVTDKIKDATDKGQQSWEEKYRFKCADGIYKYVHDHGFVVYENGLPVKMIGSLQDISELKEMEARLLEEKLKMQKEISETVIRVQEKERTRIGHELHDNVNQILATTSLFVSMIKPASREEKQAKAKSLEYISIAVEEIRKLSKELVVPQLQGKGLVDSIQTLVNDIHFSNVIKIRFTHDNESELLSPGKKVTLFRIVQEQFRNILKHSSAELVDIFLQSKGAHVQLIIKDDGVGFDPQQTHRGIGLSNIHERTRFYNGTVEIKTAPGKGCTLEVCIPVAE